MATLGCSARGLSPATAALSSKAPETPISIFEVASAELDPRSYRGLRLANGIRVLLASDPDTTKAAAALEVGVGSMNNPSRWPGLAHFCEHMLFLGTARYPDEGDFARFIR